MKWPRPLKHIKIGDAVAAVAQPIARAIDRIAGTDIEHCAGCAKRLEMLNNLTAYHDHDRHANQHREP